MIKEERLKLLKELEDLIPLGGTPNPAILRRIGQICFRFQNDYDLDPHAREKISHIKDHFGILFSQRKHQKSPGGSAGVAHFIRSDLSVVLSEIERSETK